MSAGVYDITVEQGSTFSLAIALKDSLGAAINLTGHTFRGQIRKTISDTTIQASFTFNIDAPATLGTLTATISAANTALIEMPTNNTPNHTTVRMVYDIESEIGGVVYRWLQGIANISPEATR